MSENKIFNKTDQNIVIQQTATSENPIIKYVLVGGIVLVCFMIFATYHIWKQRHNTSITVPINAPKLNETNTSTQTTYPTITPVIFSKSTYTYNTFSFMYPNTWTLFDTTSDQDFFTKYLLNDFEHGIILEKDNYLLYIGVNKYKAGGEVGDIFMNDTEFQEWKKNYDEFFIQGQKFYLYKNHYSLTTLIDPDQHASIYGAGALSEYVQNKTINDENKIFDGWNSYIQNKNGYSYIFVKFVRTDSGNPATPFSVQSELQNILETVKW